jgi:hypothetical protein
MPNKKETALSVDSNPNLVKMYKENATLGSQNLTGQLPLLKVHQIGKSQSELSDGSEPENGYFFYKPTKEQFKDVTCHVLTISRGFRAEGYKGKEDVFHQILAGVIIDEGEMKPFMTYFTGLKLEHLWAFGKEASPFTKAKPVPIPMFALKVKLTSEQVKHKNGKSFVIKFEIIKNKKGVPEVIVDEGMFTFLRDSVHTVEETTNQLIASRTGEEVDDGMIPVTPENQASSASETQKAVKGDEEDIEDIEDSDVPF